MFTKAQTENKTAAELNQMVETYASEIVDGYKFVSELVSIEQYVEQLRKEYSRLQAEDNTIERGTTNRRNQEYWYVLLKGTRIAIERMEQ